MPETRLLFRHVDEPGLNTIDVYKRFGGYPALERAFRELEPDEILSELEDSGLRGRGGAGFSMGKKASFLPRGEMDKYLCCNADESEPGAFKDRELMQKNPHQLIEGIAIAALAAGAGHAFIFIRGEYDLQGDILDAAVAEAYEAGYLGENILGSRCDVELVVHRGAGAYICGEETALLDALEGKRGNPRLKPPFPAVQGLYGGPTLINNVETLANVPHIVANGAEWFKGFGTEQSPGTKVVSVSGCVQRPGNYEVELGIPTRELICDLAGGPEEGHEVKAFYPGGSSSPVLTADDLDLPYSFEAMAEAGSMLGSGSIIVADERVSIPQMALRTARFYHHESCGKCTPCREGTNWTVKMLERVVARRGDADGPRHHRLGAGQHHRQLPLRARRLDGDAGRRDGAQVPRRVRASSPYDRTTAEVERIGAVVGSPQRSERCREPRARDHDRRRRPRGRGRRGDDARRRRQARRRRDPGLLLRAEARPAGRRLPHVPGRDRGDAEAADRLLDPGPRRDGRLHADRPGQARRRTRWSSSCSSTTRSTARSATRAASARCRTSRWAGARGAAASPTPSATSRSRCRCRPLIAIDRERCILCYRCVRFSQEVSEDEQLQLLERGDRSYVGTFDDRPYVAPFHGNITELCPVGALTSYTYRFRARPWDIEQAGSVCTLCPSQCNVALHGPRRAGQAGARPRQPRGRRRLALRQGPLRRSRCSPPRQRITGAAGPRGRQRCARSAGPRRSRRPRPACARPARRRAALVGDASNEEGYLVQRIVREALGSPHLDSRPGGGAGRERAARALAPRALGRDRATSTTPTRCW